MAEVIEINDPSELGEHRMAWNAMFAETPRGSFFQTFDWFRNYWHHFGEGQKMRVLVVRAAGSPIGILPLCVRRQRHKLGVLRTLCYPLDGWGNEFGPIGANATATLALAMKHLADSPRDWDRIELDWVPHDTSDRGRTFKALERVGFKSAVEESQATSLLDLSEGWENYLKGRSSKMRHEIRRHLRRINEVDGLRYVRRRTTATRDGGGDPYWGLYEQCEQIAQASWQAGVDDGNTLSHTDYREFYHDAHAAASRLGMVDMNVLSVHDQPAAFSYNYVHHGHVIGLRMGFDPQFSNLGAGIGLLALMLRNSCQRGDESYDLGIGDQPFKQRMRTSRAVTHRISHTPLTSWRSQAVRLGKWLQHPAAG